MAAAKKPAPRKRVAKAVKPVTVEAAAASGDRRAALEALRDRLARDIDVAPPQVTAQLAAQFRATVAELAELPAQEETSVLDQLRARRAARLADAYPGMHSAEG